MKPARFLNDHIAETVSKNPKRFIGIGTVPMQDVDLAIKEMERCVTELKMPGLEIGSNINGVNLNDPTVLSVLRSGRKTSTAPCLFIPGK